MEEPPLVVHFHGAVTTYRILKDRPRQSVIDELFRLLLLSLLEELLPAPDGTRLLPKPCELARGLDDDSVPVRYNTDGAAEQYPTFRKQLEELCRAPIFEGERAERIRDLIRPFDDYFADRAITPTSHSAPRIRRHGLG
jgi:hypothetical protein